jgi:hypothetical protein
VLLLVKTKIIMDPLLRSLIPRGLSMDAKDYMNQGFSFFNVGTICHFFLFFSFARVLKI